MLKPPKSGVMAGDFLPDLSTTRKVVSVTATEFDGILIGEVALCTSDGKVAGTDDAPSL